MVVYQNVPLWDQKAAIADVKNAFVGKEDTLKQSYDRLIKELLKKKDEIQAAGPAYIPTCNYQDIVNNNGKVPDDIAKRVHETGCFVIKGVIDPEEVLARKKEIQDYWYGNEERTGNKVRAVQNAPGLIKLRQQPDLVKCMAAANNLWHDPSGDTEWVADKPMMYIDGCRIRLAGQPGGMPAHVDSGGIDRWHHQAYRKCYEKIWQGKWEEHDAWDVTERVNLHLQCNKLFRAFQGWVAMSEAGVDKGTIRLCPAIKEQSAYYLLKTLVDPEMTEKKWPQVHGIPLREDVYPLINECLVTIPDVQPGDYVLWHCDLGHSVEYTHNGDKDSSVAYIPASPMCPLNASYLVDQRTTYLEGAKGPDFQIRDHEKGLETTYEPHPSEDDLSDLGKQLMGFAPYTVGPNDDEKTKNIVTKCNQILGF
ncbi:hypothetical protein NQZ79_g2462 [Umbelopsis isabellina]|nr:hypothetical protein NQZ79_g2462 [Umbelopsis isabellina]